MPTAGLTDEAARLSDVITELGKLDNDALVQRYVPEAKPVEGTTLREALSQKASTGGARWSWTGVCRKAAVLAATRIRSTRARLRRAGRTATTRTAA